MYALIQHTQRSLRTSLRVPRRSARISSLRATLRRQLPTTRRNDTHSSSVVPHLPVPSSRPRRPRTHINASRCSGDAVAAGRRIPIDPARPEFRQGGTLGPARKHWFRAKFGNGRFRLFFRYSTAAKIIILAWVNDSDTLRTYGAKTDAYAVFKTMLDKGNPPEDWDALLKASQSLAEK